MDFVDFILRTAINDFFIFLEGVNTFFKLLELLQYFIFSCKEPDFLVIFKVVLSNSSAGFLKVFQSLAAFSPIFSSDHCT